MSNLTVCFTHTAGIVAEACADAAIVAERANKNARANIYAETLREHIQNIRKEMNEAEAELNRLFPVEDAAAYPKP